MPKEITITYERFLGYVTGSPSTIYEKGSDDYWALVGRNNFLLFLISELFEIPLEKIIEDLKASKI